MKDSEYYTAGGVPSRCDCGRPPKILPREALAQVTQTLPGWNSEWNGSVEYLAFCHGGICYWWEFTFSKKGKELHPADAIAFLQSAHISGAVEKAIKQYWGIQV